MKTIITIPAHNEEETIGSVILKIKQAGFQDIIVVDDGSTDRTSEKAGRAGAIVYRKHKRQGLASVFRDEMRLCLEHNATTIVHFDADGQYEPKEIKKLVDKLGEGYDLVMGSRGDGWIQHMSKLKRLGNWLFTQLVSFVAGRKLVFAGQRFRDTQTGFRVFNQRVAKIPLQAYYTYTMEQVIKANKFGYKICEVPVIFYARGKHSRLMRNPFHYAYNTIKDLWRIFYPKSYRFAIYCSSRLITGLLGVLVLFVFSDRAGFPAWITNIVWIPISFILGFIVLEIFGFRSK